MFLTGNPGGPGASIIKSMYIPKADGGRSPVNEGQAHVVKQTLPNGSTYRFSRVFIRSMLTDNRILVDNDPAYVARLMSIKDEALRLAWLEGRWDVFIGQAFNFTRRHVIPPIWPIPPHTTIYMTFDWGFGAPFSIGWWWVDADNRVYRFAEWYGCDSDTTPNVGIRMTDEKIVEGIKDRERRMGISDRGVVRLCDPTCFNKKPDYKGGGQGPSTATIFKGLGLVMRPGDPSRALKIRQFRSRLQVPDSDLELPMLVVYDTCTEFIRTVPELCMDELMREDLADGQEDHVYDESCHICMARPLSITREEIESMHAAERLRETLKSLDNPARSAAAEFDNIKKTMRGHEDTEVEFMDEDDKRTLEMFDVGRGNSGSGRGRSYPV
jgi:hypothetical protein